MDYLTLLTILKVITENGVLIFKISINNLEAIFNFG